MDLRELDKNSQGIVMMFQHMLGRMEQNYESFMTCYSASLISHMVVTSQASVSRV
jgi:hypothetical protein